MQRHGSIPPRSPFGSSLFINGLLSLLFGIVVIVSPELLAYIVASFFIILGVSMLAAWWKMRR